MNDVKYLNLESKRFSLPSYAFSFADTQFLYMNKIGNFTQQLGLGKIADALGVEFIPHRAVDDAYATMRIAKAMCEADGCDLCALLEKYTVKMGRIENYEITQATSTIFENYKKEKERLKEERDKTRAQFHIFADREKRKREKEGKLKNKTVCFSHAVELDLPLAKQLLSAAFAQAARVTFRAEECDLYVCYANESGQRVQSVKDRGAKIFTIEDFTKHLGLENE